MLELQHKKKCSNFYVYMEQNQIVLIDIYILHLKLIFSFNCFSFPYLWMQPPNFMILHFQSSLEKKQ